MSLEIILYAGFLGVAPSLLWLWFWLKEDSKNPEPKMAITIAFIAGALSVLPAIALENYAEKYIKEFFATSVYTSALIIASWAFIEEVLKFLFAYFGAFRYSYYDEPIDAVIYMITVALGFAALENAMFLIKPLSEANIIESVLTGNLRFLGATLLHIMASSVVGVAMAASFHKKTTSKIYYITGAIILASVLHFTFNYSISVLNISLLSVFAYIWVGLVLLLLIFEKLKKLS